MVIMVQNVKPVRSLVPTVKFVLDVENVREVVLEKAMGLVNVTKVILVKLVNPVLQDFTVLKANV